MSDNHSRRTFRLGSSVAGGREQVGADGSGRSLEQINTLCSL